MLVITQKLGDHFVLVVDGEVIATIRYLKEKGNQHVVGIEADPEIKVYRKAIWDQIKNDKNFKGLEKKP